MNNKTHFEQVPLESVKQLAHEFEDGSQADSLQMIQPTLERQPDWKELCKAIIKEDDPKRISVLTEQLDKVLAQRINPPSNVE